MTAYFVTRHPGAIEWARHQGIDAQHIEHLDPAIIKPGDLVLGTLPVSVVAEVNCQGARYFHLKLDVPAEYRGKELTPQNMIDFGAEIEEFHVRKL